MTELLDRLATDVGGRYVVERELGRGGMATVYLARDLRDEGQVAIKVMDPELAAAVGADRFRREIEVASRLKHPNILGILDSGEAAGTSYYVMPFIKGETLRDRLDREKQLPIEDAIRIAREVADALNFAHQQGVVHRDIKPENILLDHGKALVADFGIARAASAADNKTLTKTGVALGTPHYMSPEQIFAEKDIDGRTDQYALACMLHEMLAGQPPFVGPHAQSLMAQHALDEPPLVTRFRPSTPPNVEDAILTGLAKQRADRFPTLHDFQTALENTGYTSLMKATRLRNQVPTPAQLAAMLPPKPLWRRVLPVAAALVVGVGATAGVYFGVVQNNVRNADPAVVAEMKRIAVLYFDADGGGDVPALADGLTEGLITRLRSVRDLTVVGRDGVTPFRGSPVGADSVAKVLHVGTIVTGTVAQAGDQLRVSVRLKDKSGGEIDNFSITHPVAEAYALRDKVAEQVAEKLRELVGDQVRLTVSKAGTSNAQAWTLFQRGERAHRLADSLVTAGQADPAGAKLDEADAALRQAVALDARWSAPVTARAGVALSRYLAMTERRAGKPWLDSAETLATQALALNREDADAFAARGQARALRLIGEMVPDDQVKATYDLAAADLDTATVYDPTNAGAFNMRGQLEYALKNVAKARIYTLEAYKADAYLADAPNILHRLFLSSHDLNEFEDAKKYCVEGALRFPAQPRFIFCRLIVQMMPRADSVTAASVWRVVDSLKAVTPPDRWEARSGQVNMFAAVALIRAGLKDSARRVMVRTVASAPRDPDSEMPAYEALVLTQLGDHEAAISRISQYVGSHPQHVTGFERADFWWWLPLKADPRFQDILTLAKRKLQASR